MICFDTGLPIDWTAISAIATLLMTIATFVTILYNRKQLKEIQRQWVETNGARLAFSIIASNGLLYLKIENVGNETAYNVKISINKTFLNKILVQDYKNFLCELCEKEICIPPKRVIYYALSPIYTSKSRSTQHASYYSEEINKNLDILIDEPFIVTGTYNENKKITEILTINQSTGSIIVNTPEVEELLNINKTLLNINKIFKDMSEKIQNIIGETKAS